MSTRRVRFFCAAERTTLSVQFFDLGSSRSVNFSRREERQTLRDKEASGLATSILATITFSHFVSSAVAAHPNDHGNRHLYGAKPIQGTENSLIATVAD